MKKFRRVLICGDRMWRMEYAKEIKKLLVELSRQLSRDEELLVITGGAPGVDKLVEICCDKLNIHCAVVKALWKVRDVRAGPDRNMAMASLEPVEVIAIHANFKNSKGTKNMLDIAEYNGIPFRLIEP